MTPRLLCGPDVSWVSGVGEQSGYAGRPWARFLICEGWDVGRHLPVAKVKSAACVLCLTK